MKIEYVNYGIANRFNNRIEVNKALKKYPELLKTIIKHERNHSNGKYTLADYTSEFKMPHLKIMAFLLSHPSSWIQLSPVYPSKNMLHIDVGILISWIITILLMLLGIYMLGK